MAKQKKLRMYSVKDCEDAEFCECVVAHSCKEAKQIAWDESDFISECASDGEGWIGVKVIWLKGAYVEGLNVGCIEPDADSLRRDSFSWLEESECPICLNENYITVNEYEGFRFVSCQNCAEKFENKKLKKEDIPKEAIPYKDLIKNGKL